MINACYSLLAICLCLLAGKLMAATFGGLPPSLYGMMCFSLTLHLRLFDGEKIQQSIGWIIKHMGVCFVPAGVGIINHYDLLRQHGFTLVAIIFVTTFVLLTLTGLAYQHLVRKEQPPESATNRQIS